jgi:hypothetical protein
MSRVAPIDLSDDSAPEAKSTAHQDYYGCNDWEIFNYLQQCGFAEGVQVIEPLKFTATVLALIPAARLSQQGQLLIVYQPSHRSHWSAMCIDFDNHIFGSMGAARRLPPSLAAYLLHHQIGLGGFHEITPTVGPQIESECGARAVLYCEWFATVRDRTSINRRDLDVRQFHVDVAACMAAWRALR